MSTIDSIALTLLEVSKDPNNVDIYESMYNQLLMEARETLWGGCIVARNLQWHLKILSLLPLRMFLMQMKVYSQGILLMCNHVISHLQPREQT